MLPWLKKGFLSGEMSENYEQKKNLAVTQFSWFCLSGFPTKRKKVKQACS